MIKNSIHVLLSAFFATCLISACQTVEPEETPDEEEVEVSQQRTTIPFSIKVNTETKVSYSAGAESEYSFKAGDCLHVVGTSRADLEGTLTRNGDLWSGELSYLTASGAPATDEALTVTLVHADNPDTTHYGSAIVKTDFVDDFSSMFNEAVEKYSWFTAETTLDAASATLYQQAAFLDVTVTFDFDGSREVEAGKAIVDLVTTRGGALEHSQFFQVGDTEDYYVRFIAVVPGGKTVDDFSLSVGDRAVTFNSASTAIAKNTKYTVERTVTYGPQLGDPFWSDGTYGRLVHADPDGVSIVGIIVYVNHDYTPGTEAAAIDDAITEKGSGFGHGLVMALHNVPAGSGDLWGTGNDTGGAKWCLSAGNGVQRTSTLVTTPSATLGVDALNGLDNTTRIINALGANSAAYLAQHYADAPEHTSGWFLPSIGQWLYTISVDGFGGADHASTWKNTYGANWLSKGSLGDLVLVMNNNGSSDNLLVKSLNDRLSSLYNDYKDSYPFTYDEFGWESGGVFGDNYWTSSEKDANNAFRMNLGSVETWKGNKYSSVKPKQESKTRASANFGTGFIMRIRPFLAF